MNAKHFSFVCSHSPIQICQRRPIQIEPPGCRKCGHRISCQELRNGFAVLNCIRFPSDVAMASVILDACVKQSGMELSLILLHETWICTRYDITYKLVWCNFEKAWWCTCLDYQYNKYALTVAMQISIATVANGTSTHRSQDSGNEKAWLAIM